MIKNQMLFNMLRDVRWLGFFFLILVAWIKLLDQSLAYLPHAEFGLNWYESIKSICSVTTQDGGFFNLLGMWVLMVAAMMAPSFFPFLKVYLELMSAGAGSYLGFFALFSGYLLVWLCYSLMAALLQFQLFNLESLVSEFLVISMWLNASLLLLAGVYQFSSYKQACLNQCRAPLAFYLSNWRQGVDGSLFMGINLGIICVGCCWALMALAFIGGAMSLMWMGLATILMTLEKLPQLGQLITKPLGVLLALSAFFMMGQAIHLTLILKFGV